MSMEFGGEEWAGNKISEIQTIVGIYSHESRWDHWRIKYRFKKESTQKQSPRVQTEMRKGNQSSRKKTKKVLYPRSK